MGVLGKQYYILSRSYSDITLRLVAEECHVTFLVVGLLDKAEAGGDRPSYRFGTAQRHVDVKVTAMCFKQSVVGVTQIDLLAVYADVAVVVKQYRAGS